MSYVVSTLPLLRPSEAASVQRTLIGSTLATGSLWFWMRFSGQSAAKVASLLGYYATFFCVAMFASPLSTMRNVISTGNAASILAPSVAFQCAVAATRTTHLAAAHSAQYLPRRAALHVFSAYLLELCYHLRSSPVLCRRVPCLPCGRGEGR